MESDGEEGEHSNREWNWEKRGKKGLGQRDYENVKMLLVADELVLHTKLI